MSIAAVLDPRCKMLMIDFVFENIYSGVVEKRAEEVKQALVDMFNEYKDMNEVSYSTRGRDGAISSCLNDTSNDNSSSSWSKF